MDSDLAERIQNIPKIELHLHLEGGVRKNTAMALLKERNARFQYGNPFSDQYAYENLSHFVTVMASVMDICLQTPDDYYRAALELFMDLADQNVRYAEVSFDPARGRRLGIAFEDILSAIAAARNSAMASASIQVGIIVALNRDLDDTSILETVRDAAEAMDKGVVGIDLHGDESVNRPRAYRHGFDMAGNAGLGLKAHAGESQGAPSIWETLLELGVSRIGHGVRALEDKELIRHLIRHDILLEICPTSNARLGVVPSLSRHPVRQLFDLGVPIIVNSDDPLFFNTTITDEYYLLADLFGFTCKELKKLTLNGVKKAFIGKAEKRSLFREIDTEFFEDA